MTTIRTGAGRLTMGPSRILVAIGLGLLIASCGTASATPTATPPPPPTPTPTETPTPTPAPTPSLIAITPSPVSVAPLSPLCTGPEQVAAITIWHVVAGGTEIDFLTGSHTSTSGGTLCYLRGTSEAQVVSGGSIIADSGAGTASVLDSDPYVPVAPGDKVYSSVIWSNWCSRSPRQPITIAFVLPGGLGRVVANTGSGMPAPPCVSSGSPSTVTATSAWHH